MTDVRHSNTPDGGEITITAGLAAMTPGIENAVYYSLFGGNDDDSGLEVDDPVEWWGNLGEPVDRQYRSRTQHLLKSLPATPSSLRLVQEAAEGDLAWMVSSGVVESVEALVTIPALNRVHIEVILLIDGERTSFTFDREWGA